jgi:hypothetical protein
MNIYIYTLWLFNIAMENGPFIDGLPIKNGWIFHGYVSHNQRVYREKMNGILICCVLFHGMDNKKAALATFIPDFRRQRDFHHVSL